MFTRLMALCWVFMILYSGGCGQAEDRGEEETYETIIPETTKVVSKEEASGILEIKDDGTFLVNKASAVAKKFQTENIVVSEPIAKAPSGFLRKVVSVNETGAALEIQTTQATLDQAIEEGEIKSEITLSPQEVMSYSSLTRGLSVRTAALEGEGGIGAEFPFEFDNVVLYDEDGDESTTSDQIVANGEVKLYFGFVFEAKIKSFKLKYFKFGPKASETAELYISTGIPIWDVEYKKEVAHYIFSPITVWVGIVPVVFVPELSVYVGVDGNISIELEGGITQELSIEAGIEYKNSEWQAYKEFTADFNYIPFDITAGGEIKGYVGPELKIKLYGVAGPYVLINGYLLLEANLANDPWWTLYGGVEGKGGAKIEVLSHVVAKFETGDFIGYKKILTQAETKPSVCTPDCSGKECGDNGCEGSCGDCDAGNKCQNGHCIVDILCGDGKCDPNTETCDSCPLDCGSCGSVCGDGKCETGEDYQNCPSDCKCVPDCAGKECGDDGCGGSCGTCSSSGKQCNQGKCETITSFKDNGDGTVTDLNTGLMWQKVSNAIYGNVAEEFCDDVVLGGYSDWRLPNIDELRTLIIGCPTTMPGGNCKIHDGCGQECMSDACLGCEYIKGLGATCYVDNVPVGGCYIDELFTSTCKPDITIEVCGQYWSSSSYYDFYDLMLWTIDFSDGSLHGVRATMTAGYIQKVSCVR